MLSHAHQSFAQKIFAFTDFDLNPGIGISYMTKFTACNGKVYFNNTQPWGQNTIKVTNGTKAGTYDLKDKNGNYVPQARALSAVDTLLFICASNALWVSDGTQAGTYQLKAFNAFLGSMKGYKSKLYFAADDGTNGTEIWVSDGTVAGTQMLKDILPGTGHSYPDNFELLNGKLYFSAKSDTGTVAIWETDGSSAGTHIIKDITDNSNKLTTSKLSVLNNLLIFWAFNYPNRIQQLWICDGTATGTKSIKNKWELNLNPSPWGENTAIYNGRLYFSANDSTSGIELWATDGTAAGTQLIKDINPGANSSIPLYLCAAGGKLYFSADNGVDGSELWATDGTTTGTYMVQNIHNIYGSVPRYLTNFHDRLFFTAQSFDGRNLYTTDGTASGTKIIAPKTCTEKNPSSYVNELFASDSALYFQSSYFPNISGEDLWSIKDSIDVTSASSILTNKETSLYPNPAHHNFTIKTTTVFTSGSITLTDITGRIVKTEKLYNNQQTISLQGIAPGIYMADVWLDDKRSTQKLTIE